MANYITNRDPTSHHLTPSKPNETPGLEKLLQKLRQSLESNPNETPGLEWLTTSQQGPYQPPPNPKQT